MGRTPLDLTRYYPYIAQGYTIRDLQDLGLSRYRAARVMERAPALTLPPTGMRIPLPSAQDPQVVALVASDDLARTLLGAGIYLRSRSREQQVRRIATHLGTDNLTNRQQAVDDVRIITARALIPDVTVPPQLAGPAQPAINAAWRSLGPGFLHENFGDHPVDVIVLGPRLPIRVPLGFRGAGGIPGTRHYRLNDLRNAQQLTTLKTV